MKTAEEWSNENPCDAGKKSLEFIRNIQKDAQANLFRDGYYCAVANIMRLHGEEVIARETLMNYGGVDLEGIDKGDLAILKPLAKEIERRKKAGV